MEWRDLKDAPRDGTKIIAKSTKVTFPNSDCVREEEFYICSYRWNTGMALREGPGDFCIFTHGRLEVVTPSLWMPLLLPQSEG